MSARGGRAIAWVVALIPVVFLGLFFAWPVVAILGRGLAPDGALDLTSFGDVLTDPSLRGIAWFTVLQAIASTALALLLGLPGAYVLNRVRFPGRALLHAAVIVPFVLPTVVVAAAFTGLLGRGGPLASLGWHQSLAAILVAHAFFNYAVVVRTVGSLWGALDPRPEDAARVLGASRLRAFVTITLPALRGSIVAAGAIVFLFCFTSFGIILILGGPQRATIETEIYRQTVVALDLPTAAALSLVQLMAVAVALGVAARARGRAAGALELASTTPPLRRPRTLGARAFLAGNLAVMALLLGLPILVLVARSFDVGDGLGLGGYRALGQRGTLLVDRPLDAVWTSLQYAAAATVIALVVGGAASFTLARGHRRASRAARALDGFVMLPLGVSAVTVGFGFLIALDTPPLDLRTSRAIIPIAHALVAIPFVVRIVVPVLLAIDQRSRDAAAVLGASPRRVWREVDLPIATRALGVAAGFAFAISLGEFGATLFIVRPDTTTLPVVIYRLLGRPGPLNTSAAMAASVVLMAITTIAVVAIDRIRPVESRAGGTL